MMGLREMSCRKRVMNKCTRHLKSVLMMVLDQESVNSRVVTIQMYKDIHSTAALLGIHVQLLDNINT